MQRGKTRLALTQMIKATNTNDPIPYYDQCLR
jgi:hypothetical protein